MSKYDGIRDFLHTRSGVVDIAMSDLSDRIPRRPTTIGIHVGDVVEQR